MYYKDGYYLYEGSGNICILYYEGGSNICIL